MTAGLKSRRVSFDLSSTPLQWVPGDAMTTAVGNVLHMILPAGERWFCRVLKQALPLLDDPRLRADLEGFLRQEGSHARVHTQVLEHLATLGLDTSPFTDGFERKLNFIMGDAPLGLKLESRWLKRRWLRHRVAIIAAFEHHTCVLGRWVLENADALDAAGADPTMMDLLRWHGAEEVEHRAVAYDVARALGSGWTERQVAGLVVATALVVIWSRGLAFLARADTQGELEPSFAEFQRAAREGRIPSVTRLAMAALRYLSPGYDPQQEAVDEPALAYLATSPGVFAT